MRRPVLEVCAWVAAIASAMLAFYSWFSGTPSGPLREPEPKRSVEARSKDKASPVGLTPGHLPQVEKQAPKAPAESDPQAVGELPTKVRPSFDCRKAEYYAERLICSSPRVAALDQQMASLYRDVVSTSSAERKKVLRNSQIHWLREIRDRCASESCLTEVYIARIRELDAQSR